MFRGLAVLRLVLVANTVGLNIYRDDFEHPTAGASSWSAWPCGPAISWVYHRAGATARCSSPTWSSPWRPGPHPVVKGPDFNATCRASG